MPGPVLTADEQAAIDTTIATIAAAQAEREKKMQARIGHDSDLVALGLSSDFLSDAHAAGFAGRVDEYVGPSGSGWQLVLTLTRESVAWELCHHEGPETWRGYEWREVVPAPVESA